MTWQDDEDETDVDEPEDLGPDWHDRNMSPAQVPCPYCLRQIHEDAERCPYCHVWITPGEGPRIRPWWWVVAVVLLVLLLLRYLLR